MKSERLNWYLLIIIPALIFVIEFFFPFRGNGAPKVLDSTDSGGINTLFLSEGRIYYSEYNEKEVLSVSVDGGAVTGHQLDNFWSPGGLVIGGGKIFILSTQTAGDLFSLPADSEGIMKLVKLDSGSCNDFATDGDYIYFSRGSKVFRIAAVRTGTSQEADCIFTGTESSLVRFALDGQNLFVSDSKTGDIFRMNTGTGLSIKLVSALVSGQSNGNLPFPSTIPLFVTRHYLYAFTNDDGPFSH